jgi:hypothetical protein
VGDDNDNCTLHALKLQIVAVTDTKQNKKARHISENVQWVLPAVVRGGENVFASDVEADAVDGRASMVGNAPGDDDNNDGDDRDGVVVVVVMMMVMLRAEDDRCVGLMIARCSTGGVQVKAAAAQVPKAYPALPSQAELDIT